MLSALPTDSVVSCGAAQNGAHATLSVDVVLYAPPAIHPRAPLSAADHSVTVTCRLHGVVAGANTGLATASAAIQVPHARFPLLTDVMLVSDDGSTAKSAWGRWVNLTAGSAVADGSTGGGGGGSQGALDDSRLLQLAAAALSERASSELLFSMLVSNGTRAVLVTDSAFAVPSRVAVGGVAAEVQGVGCNGRLLHVMLPSMDEVCPQQLLGDAHQAECGYARLDIHSGNALTANISCPPFCPGGLPGSVPYPSSTSRGAFVPAMPQLHGLPLPLDVPLDMQAGLYYARSCAAAGFADPASGVCTNASDPLAATCGFGAGADCRPCPVGALCPGGRRVWPRPGFYTASESSGSVSVCAPPASRCIGWDAALGVVQCAPGYRPRSVGCGACDGGYYPDDVGSCSRCPDGVDALAIARPLLIFAGALAAAAGLLYACLLLVAKLVGGTVAGGAWRMAEFVTWAISAVQVVSQVAQAASPGLPDFARAAYSAINVFQFVGVALPPACIGGYPFLGQAVQFALVLACMAVLLSLVPKIRSGGAAGCQRRARLLLVKPLFTVLLLLYPMVANAALRLVACHTVMLPLTAWRGLDHDGGTPQATSTNSAATTTVQAAVLSDNPFFVCYEGSHAGIAPVAWLVLAVFVVGYPLGTLLWVRRRVLAIVTGAAEHHDASSKLPTTAVRALSLDDRAASLLSHPVLAPFVAGDYRASRWWFRHVDLAALLWLSLILVFWSRPGSATDAAARAALTALCPLLVLCALWWFRPYPPTGAWKLPVRSLSLLLTAVAAAANGVAAAAHADPTALRALAGVVVVLSGLLLATLVVAFAATSVHGARREREEASVAAAERSRRGAIGSGRAAPTPTLKSPPHSAAALMLTVRAADAGVARTLLPDQSAPSAAVASTHPLRQPVGASTRWLAAADDDGEAGNGVGAPTHVNPLWQGKQPPQLPQPRQQLRTSASRRVVAEMDPQGHAAAGTEHGRVAFTPALVASPSGLGFAQGRGQRKRGTHSS